ncbi:hypothetical protein CYMTET_22468 [Cymbomonas tetramitiformis]|uniref:Uncharacterized protein n=1 Tax=Cymbomonas tetramitiformis TaxID=36881 RepID=A0AAE0FZU1_9CHLO|nr:hypothetical protein CYMTET_22468 [Cymbomonas tetramitiformis]
MAQAALSDPSPRPISDIGETSWPCCVILGACHALVSVGGEIMGDPIETEAVKALGWKYDPDTSISTPGEKPAQNIKKGCSLKVLYRWHFASKLQRMSTLAKVSTREQKEVWVLVKGSPEALGPLLKNKPAGYDATYRKMAEDGMRVIALAYRVLAVEEEEEAVAACSAGQGVPREKLEKDLVFTGFIAFSCLVRKDTAMIIKQLQDGSHNVIMATGDAALTGLYVAARVGITDKEHPEKALLLEGEGEQLRWASARQDTQVAPIPYRAAAIPQLVKDGHALCMTGDAPRLTLHRPPF